MESINNSRGSCWKNYSVTISLPSSFLVFFCKDSKGLKNALQLQLFAHLSKLKNRPLPWSNWFSCCYGWPMWHRCCVLSPWTRTCQGYESNRFLIVLITQHRIIPRGWCCYKEEKEKGKEKMIMGCWRKDEEEDRLLIYLNPSNVYILNNHDLFTSWL